MAEVCVSFLFLRVAVLRFDNWRRMFITRAQKKYAFLQLLRERLTNRKFCQSVRSPPPCLDADVRNDAAQQTNRKPLICVRISPDSVNLRGRKFVSTEFAIAAASDLAGAAAGSRLQRRRGFAGLVGMWLHLHGPTARAEADANASVSVSLP